MGVSKAEIFLRAARPVLLESSRHKIVLAFELAIRTLCPIILFKCAERLRVHYKVLFRDTYWGYYAVLYNAYHTVFSECLYLIIYMQ